MIYYGLQILSPAIFLPATVIIYRDRFRTTSATVGIALIGLVAHWGLIWEWLQVQ
jgi:NhaC family Na+:H+ antiporter